MSFVGEDGFEGKADISSPFEGSEGNGYSKAFRKSAFLLQIIFSDESIRATSYGYRCRKSASDIIAGTSTSGLLHFDQLR